MRLNDFSTPKIEYLDHTADLGVRVYSQDLKTLFECTAEAMLSEIAEPDTIEEAMLMEVVVKATGLPDLMRKWLDEINFRHEVDGFLFCRAEVREISTRSIRSLVFGEPYDRGKHTRLTEIKSVTFHQLQVEQLVDKSWVAQVVFDI